MVLGIPDFSIWSAYLLCLLSAAVCVIYGAVNWNKDTGEEAKEVEEERKWEQAESEVCEKL